MITEEWGADLDSYTPSTNQVIDIYSLEPAMGIKIPSPRKRTRKVTEYPVEGIALPAIFEMRRFPFGNEGNNYYPPDKPVIDKKNYWIFRKPSDESVKITADEMRWRTSMKPRSKSLWEAAIDCGAALLYPNTKRGKGGQ